MDDDKLGKSSESSDAAPQRRAFSRRRFLKYSGAAGVVGTAVTAMQDVAFGSPNPVSVENAKTGVGDNEWFTPYGDTIRGFTTQYSYLPGNNVAFKIQTASKNYRIRIYRLGYYGGLGARHLADVGPSVTLPQTQPAGIADAATGLYDCGNWAVSANWTIPADAVSGIYYALFDPIDIKYSQSRTHFVVRRNGPCDILVQTSEITMQAYNRWGGNSLYYGNPDGRSYKVSYNRPFGEGVAEENDILSSEMSLIRFLERNGFDVAYCGGIDVHQQPNLVKSAKVFVSSGHDEYTTAQQRANLVAARDAGTNLIFMTGNEYFWKVRTEPSADPAHTTDRTIVCYKETLANAKIDPSSEWTGTWRDPRFSPPSTGGRPENELTGQLFRVILPSNSPDDTILVPAEYSKLRFWRNTAVASLAPGQTRSLSPNTLGYEFDCDVDNGYRPPGLIRLSSTTVQVPQLLQDYGATYASGTTTHNMTMYRAPSGALVWGTGTVQWAYGLDSYHITDPGTPTDPVMQQATVNVLADMGVQPTTLQTGLVRASMSTDTMPPTTNIATPAEGANLPVGSPVTISGTATELGGGQIAGVEVSVDGATWHPATGTTSWSYVYTPAGVGALTIRARAVDDSCNIESPGSVVHGQGAPRTLPAPIWPDSYTPTTPAVTDAAAIEVGVKFRSTQPGFITGLRFYKGAGNTGTHVGNLWTSAGALLATATFVNETATGWQNVSITPVAISANTTYVCSVFMPVGHYAADAGYFNSAFDLAPLRALASGEDGPNGLFRYGSSGFPTGSFGSANYWVDIMFNNDDGKLPTVVNQSPAANIGSVARTAPITATFSEAMTPASVVLGLRDSGGVAVNGTTAYDSNTRTVTFTPSAALGPVASYSATVSAAKDIAGNSIAAPFSWSFTTIGDPGSSPASLWDTSAAPATVGLTDTSPVELGTKFTSSVNGSVTALRYFKPLGTSGTHVGHLWDGVGNLLATAPFTSESASGWQQVTLPAAVPITAGTTYVVSYYAPNGVFGLSGAYFSASVNRAPLQAPAGANGVYRYGASGFPSTSNNSTNYWADVLVTIQSDTTPPTLTNQDPAADVIAVAIAQSVLATFSEAINPSSLSMSLKTATGTAVPATATYDAASKTASLVANSPLTRATKYTATVSATDTAGNAMTAPVSWSFTTVTASGVSPSTIWDSSAVPATAAASDGSAIEVGTRIKVDHDGAVTGIRFYKGATNTGSHVGHLWGLDGTLLGSTPFVSESATGWQQAMFGAPIPVTGGTTYVASYYAPVGRYAVTANGLATAVVNPPLRAPASVSGAGNGLYKYGASGFPNSSYSASNYWVDVILADTAAPTVVGQSPDAGSNGAPVSTTVMATFSEDVQPASIVFKLRDGGGAVLSGGVTYDSGSTTATFTPAAALNAAATYTASVEAALDLSGTAMTAAAVWSFSTVGNGDVQIWANSVVPATLLANDGSALEIGLKFRSNVAGVVKGVRFYKGGPTNGGTHIGNLWSAAGAKLATVTFGAETARGWQMALFATPVAITPNTTYVVSYLAPQGRYSVDGGYLSTSATVSGPLTALQTGTDGGNGLYKYGATGGFPTGSGGGSNYWIDLVFAPTT